MTATCRVIHWRAEGAALPAKPAARVVVGLAVMGAHLVGVIAWWTLGHDMPLARTGGALAPLTVWLPQLQAPIRETLQRTAPAQSLRPERRQTGGGVDQERVNESVVQPSAAPSAEGAVTEAEPPPLALNLNLSRKALTTLAPPSAAALSPFHGRLPATVEQVIANAAAESGPWTEERLDNDHIRLRRGTTCVLLERPQAAALDPFSDAARRLPWRASASRC